ncbi:unnamed protein product [Sympodiomycopsis kandeliae]
MSSTSSADTEPLQRPTVRYQAQAHPSQNSRSAVEERGNAWVGAFERVLGDHAEEQDASAAAAYPSSTATDRERKSAAAAAASTSAENERGSTTSSLRRTGEATNQSSSASSSTATASGAASKSLPKPSPRRQTPSRQRSHSHLMNTWQPSADSKEVQQQQQPPSSAQAKEAADREFKAEPSQPQQQRNLLHPESAAKGYPHPSSSSSNSKDTTGGEASKGLRPGPSVLPGQASSAVSHSNQATTSASFSGARLSHKGSNRALRTQASNAASASSGNSQLLPAKTTPQAPSTRATHIRSYGPAPQGEEEDDDDDDVEGHGDEAQRQEGGDTAARNRLDGIDHPWSEASLGLARTSSGPTILEVNSRHQKNRVCFPDLYLNHAPGLQPVRLRNILGPGKSVLVRLESDMGHAISFMRRKRTAPKNELAKLAWPSNTLGWARGDGLSPQNLRELRAISVNLEVADSLILEGGASTEIFVIFRPSVLPAEKVPEPADSQAPSDARARSQSSVINSSATITGVEGEQQQPLMTPAAASTLLQPQDGPSSGSTSAMPPSASASPRSAPEVLRPVPQNTSTPSPLRLREATGSITVRAWQLPTLQPFSSTTFSGRIAPPEDSTTASEDAATTTSSRSSAASSRPTSLHGGSSVSSAGASMSTAITELSEVEPQSVTLPVIARFCRPQISLGVRQPCIPPSDGGDGTRTPGSMQKQGLCIADFGDVTADQPVTTEVTLSNPSDIDCYWQCRVDCEADEENAPPCVSICDLSTSQELGVVRPSDGGAAQYLPHVLPPRTTMKIKLTLKPQHADTDMEEIVTFTNLHNTSNSIRVAIRANVQAQGKATALQVGSGDSLDFGDCCGGQWTRQLLILRNTADYPIDVALNAQKGYEVTFQQAEVADHDEGMDLEEMNVGATAASSDGSSVLSDLALSEAAASEKSHNSNARHQDFEFLRTNSELSQTPLEEYENNPLTAHHTIAMELARTPTHHASIGPGVEPPTFDLGSNASSEMADLERTPVVLTPFAHPPAPTHETREGDEEDNSSVASQAGSRPASPTPSLTANSPSFISDLDCHSGSGIGASSTADQSEASSSAAKKNRTKDNVLAWREGNKGSESDVGSLSRSRRQSGSFSTTSGVASNWTGEGGSEGRKVLEEEAVSTTSEVTSASQGNRSTAASVMTRSASSLPRSHHQQQQRGSHSSALRSLEQRDAKYLEDLTLRPGEEYRIIISHRPQRGEADETSSAGRLVENTFRLILDYTRSRSTASSSSVAHGSQLRPRPSRERKVVICRIRTCTSLISVTQTELDFGEVNVGSRKSGHIEVRNHSDLSARVDLRFVSKVLSMYRDEMAIPANQSIHLTVDYSPRRVNLAYSKQITVANLLNRHNDQIIDVRGKNVDKQRISFHSLFYRILTPDGSNFLEFGDVNINSSRVRTFSIENTSKAPLTLDITTAHPEDVALYVKAAPPKSSPSNSGMGASGASTTDSALTLLRATKGYEDAEPSSLAKSTISRALSGDGSKPASNPKGAELKERFLESISSDTPANVRQENTSWRTAQQMSHFRKGAAPTSILGSVKEGHQQHPSSGTTGAGAKSKPAVNLVSALKKGGKGRITQAYGKCVTFKDRSLLQMFEDLDLASGPPLTANRISVKSRCFQTLEQLETVGKPKVGRPEKGVVTSSATGEDVKEGEVVAADGQSSGESSNASGLPPSTPVAKSKQRIPAPLARDIKSKAGTPSKPIGKAVSKSSPALTGKKKLRQTALDPGDVSDLSLEELLSALESQPSTLSTLFFNSWQAEEKHVRMEINLLRQLRHVVEEGQLEPLEMLSVAPGEERQVVAIYCPNGSTRPHIQGTARKQDSRIFLRLVDFDVDAVRESEEFGGMANLDKDELPIRDLMVRTTTCRALLELGQPHINFGQMEKGESKTRKILIHNRSEWAARYCIRKSGSIASGDIKLSSGRYGVVSAHGKREVEFVFSPSLTGPFQEKLIIENVGDRDRDLTVSLKAHVRKKPNFTVEPRAIDFGDCKPGKLADAQSFTVSNTTNKARTFVVAVDSSDLRHQRTIMDLVFTAASDGDNRSKAEDASIADEIEHLSQKLKIATRKGHEDKIKKYEARLSELGVPKASDGASKEGDTEQRTATASSSTDEAIVGGGATVVAEEEPASSRLKRVSSTVTVGLAANQSKRITVRLRSSAIQTALTAQDSRGEKDVGEGEDVRFNVQIHEIKNQDETINVVVRARALWNVVVGQGSPPSTAVQPGSLAEQQQEPLQSGKTVSQPHEGNSGEAEISNEQEEVEVDPLPTDGSAIIFTSNTL